ncbi:hypothetical protein, partial [Corynebacterium tapiri]
SNATCARRSECASSTAGTLCPCGSRCPRSSPCTQHYKRTPEDRNSQRPASAPCTQCPAGPFGSACSPDKQLVE